MRRRLLQLACKVATGHRLTEYDFLPDVYHCTCKRRQETPDQRRARICHTRYERPV